MSKLLASTCVGLGVILLLGCQPTNPDVDEDEDLPATPIAYDDAPGDIAAQICASMFACDCQTAAQYTDEADCVEQKTAQIALELDERISLDGGTWQPECAGELAKIWSKWDCLGPKSAANEASYDARVCPIIMGNLAAGAECWNSNLGGYCGEGLACVDQVCIKSPTFPVPLGGVCEYQWETLPCAAGSYCKWNSNTQESTCVARPQAGDPCDPNSDYLCGVSAYDLICDQDSATCTPAPGVGEPCFNQFLCGPGTYCDGGKDFTCQPRRELGDGCGADAVCPVDASCLSNICTANQAAVCSLQNWP